MNDKEIDQAWDAYLLSIAEPRKGSCPVCYKPQDTNDTCKTCLAQNDAKLFAQIERMDR